MPSSRRPSPARGRATRGPLPPGVYWRRRVFVLGIAFALVFVIARWLTAGGDGSSDDEKAADRTTAEVTPSRTVTAGAEGAEGADPSGAGEADGTAAGATPPATPVDPMLIPPEGACDAADVLITPSVAEGAIAGRDVLINLSLQTRESPACTWQIASDTLVVKVAQKGKDVWTTRQCPKAVPEQSVVVRQGVATVVPMTWAEARTSTDACAKNAGWAPAGTFTIAAAALGGEPAETSFALGAPAPETIQVTPKEKKTKKAKKPKTPVN